MGKLALMIKLQKLHKVYGHGSLATYALKGVDLNVNAGEFVAIMGRSGSGKSTLLRILGLLDIPTRGNIFIESKNVLQLSEGEKAKFRLAKLGYVFQEYLLLSEMTILENVYVPALGLGKEISYRKRAVELLDVVGLAKRLNHYPNEISGGEQQRVSVARAVINQPRILFADEPTASLDATSARNVLELFKKLNTELGQTIVMVTHEPEDEKYVDRVIWLNDGLIEREATGSRYRK
jgi:putative ABC transport system ATP-binding protein